LCGDIVISVVQNKIRFYIENTSIDNYHESFIKSFEQVYFFEFLIKYENYRLFHVEISKAIRLIFDELIQAKKDA
jgi:hypothetical protein